MKLGFVSLDKMFGWGVEMVVEEKMGGGKRNG